MKTTIKDISTIQTGLFAKPSKEGELVYLQSKHFDDYGQLDSLLHPDLMAKGISDKHILKHGDILFAAKGVKNFATVYERHNLPAVASTSFFVIRLNTQTIKPEYLAWHLNSQSTQSLIKGQALGTSIASISKSVLENLEITVPSISIQDAILQITKLRHQEKVLKSKIENLREKQIQQQIFNAIQ